MLQLRNVHASYGPIEVLFGIDLEVREGEMIALLGTNGAGKTTVLRTISGVLEPCSGRRGCHRCEDGGRSVVEFDGESLVGVRPPDIVKQGIVQMPGGRGVFPGMTVAENLEIAGFLYDKKDRRKKKQMIERVFTYFPVLAQRKGQMAGSMSGGQQQMLTLAKSFVMDPKLLCIDELSLGLAPVIVEDLLEIVRRFNAEGVSVILVEQHVDLALDVASRAYFLERGEVQFAGPSEDLRGRDDLLRSVFLSAETVA